MHREPKFCEIRFFSYSDMDYIKVHLGTLASQLYALESMIYFTTGLIDEYDNPKVDLETAITKVSDFRFKEVRFTYL